MQIDPFENTVAPQPRDTIPNAPRSYDHLEAEICRLELGFVDLNVKLRLAQECLDGISSAARQLSALYRKETL